MVEREFAHGGADDFRQVRAAPMKLSQIVRERANVGSRAAFHGEARDRAFDARQPEFENFHFDGFEIHGLMFSREFVRRAAVNFLRGK